VYATNDGSWINESTDPMAGSHTDAESRENAKVLLAQEELVLKSGHPTMVFRLAGIYGPGRNRVRAILEGRVKPTLNDLHMNRIHIHDIVRGVRLLLDKGSPGQVYLGADDAPCTQREFYSWVFEKLSMALPEIGAIHESPLLAHGSNKRISNKKIKTLGLKFRYPTYREGYQPLIDEITAETSRSAGERPRSSWLS
jgi:nucleoside-diphosphate-sugar epimerase